MAPILVILTVLICILVELVRNSLARKVSNPAKDITTSVDGISMPLKLGFYPAHLWVKEIDETTAIVGIDDFARRLVGDVQKIILPMKDLNVEVGKTCIQVQKKNRKANLVTPLSGKILEVNEALRDSPDLLFKDPYGEGWLFKIRTWRLREQIGGLLSGDGAQNWMKSTMQRLRIGLAGEVGMVAQDGGFLHEDLSEHLDPKEWARFVKEFLDSESSY